MPFGDAFVVVVFVSAHATADIGEHFVEDDDIEVAVADFAVVFLVAAGYATEVASVA